MYGETSHKQKSSEEGITFIKAETNALLGWILYPGFFVKACQKSFNKTTLYNVCSVHQGIFSTSGDVQYIGGCSVHRENTMSTLGEYHEYIGGHHEHIGGCSVHQGIS